MLRVTVELVPYGMERWKYDLLHMEISNEGPSQQIEGFYDYHVVIEREGVRKSSTVGPIDRDVPIDTFIYQILVNTST